MGMYVGAATSTPNIDTTGRLPYSSCFSSVFFSFVSSALSHRLVTDFFRFAFCFTFFCLVSTWLLPRIAQVELGGAVLFSWCVFQLHTGKNWYLVLVRTNEYSSTKLLLAASTSTDVLLYF